MSAAATVKMHRLSLSTSGSSARASRLLGRDWAKSLLAHAAMLTLLVIGVQWKTKQDDAVPVMMELYSPAAPIAVKPVPIKPVVPEIETPKMETKVETKPDIAIKKEVPKEVRKEVRKEIPKEMPKETPKDIQKSVDKKALDKADELAKAASEKEALEADKLREETLRKIMASASGPSNAGEKANQTGGSGSALDPGYIGRVRSLIRSKTIFQVPDNMTGNPKAEFVVTVLPDCTVSGVKLKKSSGNSAWDDAAGRAISGLANLPRPSSGACQSSFEISHQPKE